jgi:hypothetical protein
VELKISISISFAEDRYRVAAGEALREAVQLENGTLESKRKSVAVRYQTLDE